jgi:hypothetical protein
MIQTNERVSIIAVVFLGAAAVGLLGLMALHRDSILPLSGSFGVCIGALAGICSGAHPKPTPTGNQTDVQNADSVTVQAAPAVEPPAG